jgi:predicted AlkP superfamily phosphohydrolase/phosphomutase
MIERPKVLVIGLDGAEKDLILSWAESGRLPTFRRLVEAGAWGPMRGPLGMHAASAWHSLFTAVSPARNGRHADRQIRSGTYEMYRFAPTDVKREAFWNVLSRAQRRVAVVDVPYVALSKNFDGIHVVDWTTHAADTGFVTWPPHLARQLREQFGMDPVGLCDHKQMRTADDFAAFRDALAARVQMKVAASRHLLRHHPWDLFMTVFGESHCIGHRCWHLHDASHPRYDAAIAGAIGDPLLAVYRALDDAIGQLLDAVGSSTTVLVVCSHGMGPNYTGAHLLGEILARLGHRPPPSQTGAIWRVMQWSWRQLPLPLRRRLIPLQQAAVDVVWPALEGGCDCYDVPNGEVYGAIRINLAGREPQGKVQPGKEYEDFCETLARDLCAVVNADTGQPAVRRVLRTSEIYTGPYLDHLPDLLVEWSGDALLSVVHSPKTGTIRIVLPGERTGHHRPQGFFVAVGPGIQPQRVGESVSVMDVGPTIAALLGVELPDVDGRPITACIPGKYAVTPVGEGLHQC